MRKSAGRFNMGEEIDTDIWRKFIIEKNMFEFRNVYVICNVSRIVSVIIILRCFSPGFFVCLLCSLLRDKYLISRVFAQARN